MSIEHIKRPDGTIGDIVICDVCGARMHDEAIDWGSWDWSWQKQYVDVNDEYVVKHLCARCRPRVVWCEDCQTFHYRNSTHKVTCTQCGREFRAFVKQSGKVCANCAGLEDDHSRWWVEALGSSRPQNTSS
ncbi:MAG: hypothetical protein JXA89_07530 [Anaerolineae bacterium]|nr:hypothetical protein [Anaerolineae bacterium]